MAKRKALHALCAAGVHTFPDGQWKCTRCRRKIPRASMPRRPMEMFGFSLLSSLLGTFMDGVQTGRAEASMPEVEFEFYETGKRPANSWRRVLGFGDFSAPSLAEVKKSYRERAKQCHPDKGGDPEQFKILTAARDAALKELSV